MYGIKRRRCYRGDSVDRRERKLDAGDIHKVKSLVSG